MGLGKYRSIKDNACTVWVGMRLGVSDRALLPFFGKMTRWETISTQISRQGVQGRAVAFNDSGVVKKVAFEPYHVVLPV